MSVCKLLCCVRCTKELKNAGVWLWLCSVRQGLQTSRERLDAGARWQPLRTATRLRSWLGGEHTSSAGAAAATPAPGHAAAASLPPTPFAVRIDIDPAVEPAPQRSKAHMLLSGRTRPSMAPSSQKSGTAAGAEDGGGSVCDVEDPEEDSEELSKRESTRTLSGAARRALFQHGEIVTARGHAAEWARCFVLQFWPAAVTRAEFRILRASFMQTHRVSGGFDFLDHLLAAIEHDFAKIVGLGIEMWLSLILLVLLSGLLGWATLPLFCIAAALLLATNTKLKQIM